MFRSHELHDELDSNGSSSAPRRGSRRRHRLAAMALAVACVGGTAGITGTAEPAAAVSGGKVCFRTTQYWLAQAPVTWDVWYNGAWYALVNTRTDNNGCVNFNLAGTDAQNYWWRLRMDYFLVTTVRGTSGNIPPGTGYYSQTVYATSR